MIMEQKYDYSTVIAAYKAEIPRLNELIKPYGLEASESCVYFSHGDDNVKITVYDKIAYTATLHLVLSPVPMAAEKIFEDSVIVDAIKQYKDNAAYIEKFQAETGIIVKNKPSVTMYKQDRYDDLWYDDRAMGLVKLWITMADLAKYLDQLKDRPEFKTYKHYILDIIRRGYSGRNGAPSPTSEILVAPFDKFVERCYNKKLEQKYNDLAVDLIQEALGTKHKGK